MHSIAGGISGEGINTGREGIASCLQQHQKREEARLSSKYVARCDHVSPRLQQRQLGVVTGVDMVVSSAGLLMVPAISKAERGHLVLIGESFVGKMNFLAMDTSVRLKP